MQSRWLIPTLLALCACGSSSSGSGSVPSCQLAEICDNKQDDDCNGAVDDGCYAMQALTCTSPHGLSIDVKSDSNNCGRCGNVCPTPAKGPALCVDGACVAMCACSESCKPASPEECCPGAIEELPCGGGGCGKLTRTCDAWGHWLPVSTCVARAAGVTCRPSSQECDAQEVCDGASLTCPADYKEYSLPGRPGCWKNETAGFVVAGRNCPGGDGCYPGHAPTANKLCELRAYRVATSSTDHKPADDQILVSFWNGTGWQIQQIGGGSAMYSISCLR